MTPQQIELVKSTVPVLREHGVTLTTYFYKRMLNNNPELKNVFNLDDQTSLRQPRALAAAVLAYAENIENPTVLAKAVERASSVILHLPRQEVSEEQDSSLAVHRSENAQQTVDNVNVVGVRHIDQQFTGQGTQFGTSNLFSRSNGFETCIDSIVQTMCSHFIFSKLMQVPPLQNLARFT